MEKLRISSKDLLKMLPHRYPILLVDYIEDIQHNVSAVGVKNVSIGELWIIE